MMFDFSPIFSIVVIVCVGSIECNRFNDTNGVRPEYGPKIMNGTFAKAGQFISQVAVSKFLIYYHSMRIRCLLASNR